MRSLPTAQSAERLLTIRSISAHFPGISLCCYSLAELFLTTVDTVPKSEYEAVVA